LAVIVKYFWWWRPGRGTDSDVNAPFHVETEIDQGADSLERNFSQWWRNYAS